MEFANGNQQAAEEQAAELQRGLDKLTAQMQALQEELQVKDARLQELEGRARVARVAMCLDAQNWTINQACIKVHVSVHGPPERHRRLSATRASRAGRRAELCLQSSWLESSAGQCFGRGSRKYSLVTHAVGGPCTCIVKKLLPAFHCRW